MSTMLRDNNFLGRKSVHTLILTLIFVFFTSCSNIGIFQNGGLVIAVPGSRSASESTIFTVTVADTAGNKQSKNIVAGESAQFDDLVPGPYSISVEGKESDISTMYGVAEVSVAAGKTATASVSLSTVAHTFEALQLLIEKGGTVYIGSDIELTAGLQVKGTNVKIVPLKNVVLKNNSTEPLFTVGTSTFSLGGSEYTLTLDGNNQAQHGVKVTEASFFLEKNTVITNCANSGVYITSADFTMNGGTITKNTASSGGGVHVFQGTFIMNDGSITANELSGGDKNYGGGVYIENCDFTMNGGIISNNTATLGGGMYVLHGTFFMNDGLITENKLSGGDTSNGGGIYVENCDLNMNGGSITNHTEGIQQGGGIWVAETGDFKMINGTITGNSAEVGGGVYLFGIENGDKATCTLDGGTITGNSSTNASGADIYAENTTFTNNGATVEDVVIQE